ncbi:YeeE/YedE thiosulfate transporter family protein [Candidatus Magnetomonas plexicatena]|uniref:YeeE/YedE thiosulfate transporter family protein n=1 Tax=Candidatus Magnetomonas plexicatena TaxID=2552947 RepID=UPI001C77F690|nr:YeeE/YedE family protein [Nitrospirales bacterium LBB_01]
MDIISGLIIGFVFGFALWKAGALRYSVVVGALLLKDIRLYGFMMTALATVVLGIIVFKLFGVNVEIGIRPYWGLSHVIGGGVFGVGMGLLGMCPGTCVGRLGTGKYLALLGVMGVLSASFIAEKILPLMGGYGLRFEEPKELTIYQQFGVEYFSGVVVLEILVLIFLFGLFYVERKKAIEI